MKIFIAGATGFVGGHLTAELLRRGHQLVLLSHGAPAAERPGVSYVRGDVTDPASYQPAVSELRCGDQPGGDHPRVSG